MKKTQNKITTIIIVFTLITLTYLGLLLIWLFLGNPPRYRQQIVLLILDTFIFQIEIF